MSELKFEVYLITTLDNVPIYAGHGRALKRAQNHLSLSGSKKLGYDSSKIKISKRIFVETKNQALDLEENFILRFKPKCNKAKRDERLGCKHSQESIEKIRQSNLGQKRLEETKKKMSNARIGIQDSDETKQRKSESAKLGWLKRKNKEIT